MSTKVPVQAAADLTLVVPVRDEEHTVDRLAAQIAAQHLEPAAVIFVDGGSTDGTVDRLRGWCGRHPSWRVIETADGTPGRGRNVGIDAATTEWIALTDAGIDIDPSWLARLMRVADSHPGADVVWGNYEAAPPRPARHRPAARTDRPGATTRTNGRLVGPPQVGVGTGRRLPRPAGGRGRHLRAPPARVRRP